MKNQTVYCICMSKFCSIFQNCWISISQIDKKQVPFSKKHNLTTFAAYKTSKCFLTDSHRSSREHLFLRKGVENFFSSDVLICLQ